MTMNMDKLVHLYINNIMRLHDTPIYVVSIRDDRFTARVWKEFQEVIGTKLKFSTTCHPLIDGQSERTIKILEDLFRSC